MQRIGSWQMKTSPYFQREGFFIGNQQTKLKSKDAALIMEYPHLVHGVSVPVWIGQGEEVHVEAVKHFGLLLNQTVQDVGQSGRADPFPCVDA